MEFGLGSPQDWLESQVLGESKTINPHPSVAILEKVSDAADNVKSWSTDEKEKDSEGLLLENENESLLNIMPLAFGEENGNSGESPNVELVSIENTAAQPIPVVFSTTELVAPLENQMSSGEKTVTMAKSILTSISARSWTLYPDRGGSNLCQIFQRSTTMEALDFKNLECMIQPPRPWNEKWLKFRSDNFMRIRNQLRMSPSWAKPRPLPSGPGPFSKVGPPSTSADVILEQEQVHEFLAAALETHEIVSQVSTGERPEIFKIRIRKDWKPRANMDIMSCKLVHSVLLPPPPLDPIANKEKWLMHQTDAIRRVNVRLRKNRLPPSFQTLYPRGSLDCDDDYRHLPRYYLNKMHGEKNSMSKKNTEEKKKENFFKKIMTRKGSRNSRMVSTLPLKDFPGESKAIIDIPAMKKNMPLKGNRAAADDLPKFEDIEKIEESILASNNFGLDNIATPPARLKRSLGFQSSVDFLLCRNQNRNESETQIPGQLEFPSNSTGSLLEAQDKAQQKKI